MTGVVGLEEFRRLLARSGIKTAEEAVRSKDLAKLGDPLTNLLHSLARSLAAGRFEGAKVSGKALASALHLADMRQIAPTRMDAHGLGDCVEALIAYSWLQGRLHIPEAAALLARELQRASSGDSRSMRSSQTAAQAFAALLRHIWREEHCKHGENEKSQ